MGPIRRTVLFTGHVQGVGFRYTAHNIASRHDVRGYVRNLPDGRVEMIVEGAPAQVQLVVDAVCDRMQTFIRQTNMDDSPATGEFSGFTIRH